MVKFGLLRIIKSAFLTTFEHLLEVELLPNIGHTDDPIAFEIACSVSDGGQISSCISKSSI